MKKLIIVVSALLLAASAADAKWWIFGKSGGEVGLKYLHINKVSADETGAKIKVYKETLGSDGLLRINGKAATGKSAVGSVRISLDDKATWTDVKFADNGTFEHSFKPEAGKTYTLLVEITDTAGKTNKVDETRKEITVSADPIQLKVREALDALFDAYNREELQKFLAWVGENFAGDKAMLERAVKRDFDALSNILMRYTINSVSAGQSGRIFVSITFNRMVMVNKTGAMNTDSGATEFVFDSREGKLALYSMKQPLVFGLSDAANVATGEVLGNTADNLTLDETGTLGGSGTLVTLSCPASSFPAYTFSTGSETCGAGSGDIWFYDVDTMPANLVGYSAPEKTFPKTLSSLTETEVRNLTGYASSGSSADAGEGYSYCFSLGSEFHCFEMVSSRPTAANETVTIRVKQF